MNKKVGLCIVHSNQNYGSLLQSYATMVKLNELNVDYEIIKYSPKKNLMFKLKSIPRLINKDLRYSKIRILKKKLGLKKNPEFKKNSKIREESFKKFTQKNFIKFSSEIDSYDKLKKAANNYTDILVGSDQLWLPSGLSTNFYNLMFVPKNINKVSYAASFGVSEIPFYQINKTREYLNRIENISVREFAGKEIVKRLTDKDVSVIADPTLALSKEKWDEIIPEKQIIKEKYIFCYFLGNNQKAREEAKKLAEKTGLKIVTLRHLDEYIKQDENFGDYAPYNIGPEEFVNLIRNSEYVYTDSFHGTVFSILFHKKFITFSRYADKSKNSRNSRIDTLFNETEINRKYDDKNEDKIFEDIDYKKVDKNLEHLREKNTNFLKKALKI